MLDFRSSWWGKRNSEVASEGWMHPRPDTSSISANSPEGCRSGLEVLHPDGSRQRISAAIPRLRRQRVIWLHEPAISYQGGMRCRCRVEHDSARSARDDATEGASQLLRARCRDLGDPPLHGGRVGLVGWLAGASIASRSREVKSLGNSRVRIRHPWPLGYMYVCGCCWIGEKRFLSPALVPGEWPSRAGE